MASPMAVGELERGPTGFSAYMSIDLMAFIVPNCQPLHTMENGAVIRVTNYQKITILKPRS